MPSDHHRKRTTKLISHNSNWNSETGETSPLVVSQAVIMTSNLNTDFCCASNQVLWSLVSPWRVSMETVSGPTIESIMHWSQRRLINYCYDNAPCFRPITSLIFENKTSIQPHGCQSISYQREGFIRIYIRLRNNGCDNVFYYGEMVKQHDCTMPV